VAQKVSVSMEVTVAWIFDPAQTFGLRIAAQRGSAEVKQRPPKSAWWTRRDLRHRGKAPQTGAAKQLEQQCLCLIVLVMGGQEQVPGFHGARQRRVTGRPGRRL
jgi:hypothetical protein